MTTPTPISQERPSYAPENRSPSAGKWVAIGTFALLMLGVLAALIVVLNRGSAGIVTPKPIIPSARDQMAR